MLFMLMFMVLNIVNSLVLTSIGYNAATWQYWVSSICVCGSYLVGCLKYMLK